MHTFGNNIIALKHKLKKILYSKLICNISQARLNFIYYKVGMDNSKHICKIRITYNLTCVCIISNKLVLNIPTCMDEVHPLCKRFWFDDDDVVKYCNQMYLLWKSER